jgi:hypothetical protein
VDPAVRRSRLTIATEGVRLDREAAPNVVADPGPQTETLTGNIAIQPTVPTKPPIPWRASPCAGHELGACCSCRRRRASRRTAPRPRPPRPGRSSAETIGKRIGSRIRGLLRGPDLALCGADDGIRTRDPHLGKWQSEQSNDAPTACSDSDRRDPSSFNRAGVWIGVSHRGVGHAGGTPGTRRSPCCVTTLRDRPGTSWPTW